MARTIGIGHQDFGQLIQNNYFYVDKTNFIKEWWESGDAVTLIARPRRFGKTLTMSMLEYFFSIKYADKGNLFEGLAIWQDESSDGDKASEEGKFSGENYKYRQLQGTYPVISLSFANVKETDYRNAREKICQLIASEYARHAFLLEGDCLTEQEKDTFRRKNIAMGDVDAALVHRGIPKEHIRKYGFAFRGKEVLIGQR